MIENVIIIAIVALIISAICVYLYKAKKSGQACIGCPNSKSCKGYCVCDSQKEHKSK